MRQLGKRWGVDTPHGLTGITIALVAATVMLYAVTRPMNTTDAVLRTLLLAAIVTFALIALWGATRAVASAEAIGRYETEHDDVTGLLTRRSFFDHLERRLLRDRRDGRLTAVLIIDCDDFTHVNDTWGHPAGDDLLRTLGRGLSALVGDDALLARQSGDEFVVGAAVDDPEEAVALAERLQGIFAEPFEIALQRYHHVTASIGVTVGHPTLPTDSAAILREADLALREAKTTGRGRIVPFEDDLRRRSVKRAAVADALQVAIRTGRVRPAFQPILTGPRYDHLAGWEALARWHDPFLGPVSPTEFIPIAEEQGLICELGDVILRQSCLHLATIIRALGCASATVSVNVSAPQLLQPDFVDDVRTALEESGLRPANLVLEITESMLVDENSPAIDTLQHLHQLGVSISLDDFGTGYASITTLMRMPMDCVKLDRSLVARLEHHDDAEAQVQAILELVRSLHIDKVIAEGVETAAEAEALRAMGCPMVQGWLFGRPAAPDRILRDHQQRATSRAAAR